MVKDFKDLYFFSCWSTKSELTVQGVKQLLQSSVQFTINDVYSQGETFKGPKEFWLILTLDMYSFL